VCKKIDTKYTRLVFKQVSRLGDSTTRPYGRDAKSIVKFNLAPVFLSKTFPSKKD
jgi:hypothetical protein